MGSQKRSHSQDEDTPSSSKKIKTEEQYVWEWEDDGHKWTPFSKELNADIKEAFVSGLLKSKIKINDKPFDIIFERMVQRNSKTFWERRLRLNKEDEDGGLSGTYHFESAEGDWELYNNTIQRLIYAAVSYNMKEVTYQFQGQRYKIDFINMEQVNIKTKTKRKISATAVEVAQNSSVSEQQVAESKTINTSKSLKRKVLKENNNKQEENQVDVKKEPESKTRNKPVEKTLIKSVSFQGKAPVDSECFAREKYHVYYEGETIFDAMLNQTNLKNNNNKFFLMQVLQTNNNSSYAVWFRWGRVGMTGQSNLINCAGDLEKAKNLFCKKFLDKTKNEFSERDEFEKVPGKYDMLIMDYKTEEKEDTTDGPVKKEKKELPASKLDQSLQTIIEIICNIQAMEDAIIEMKYDTKKAPLGKLTKEQVKAGYKALKLIDKHIRKKETGNKLIEACNAFYTRIPHCFGMQRPPIIRTPQEVELKMELLEALGDIEIAMNIMKTDKPGGEPVNPVDRHYNNLNCELNILPRDHEEFQLIERYTQNTHAKTHSQYKMEVLEVVQVKDERREKAFVDVGNRMLLYHGSRMTNWCGILSQGLRIAPPEAPVTGYMFGKGIYFADMSSKSANYCHPTRSKNTGFVMLCEVSLGKTNDLLVADYEADKLPNGFNSVKGLGKIAPQSEEFVTMSDGVIVPCGLPGDTGVNNPNGFTLNYNEYVVYDTKQVKPRYLVHLKFNFK